jgi:hypothetical protein
MVSKECEMQNIPSPRFLFENRSFVSVALDPPDFEPGSWIGAGKAIYDEQIGSFVITARPRRAWENVRGYACNIYTSPEGTTLTLRRSVTKEEVQALAEMPVQSIEGTQLLRNPDDGRWHLFVSVDTGEDFIWGGVQWETILLTSDSLDGPWEYEGKVLGNDELYDAHQARDATVDIVNGSWLCLYKAKDSRREERPALATSSDGVNFQKHGTLTIDGSDTLAFLSGTIFPHGSGERFIGLRVQLSDSRNRRTGVVYADEHGIGHGGGPAARFVAYDLDRDNMDLRTVFDETWTPLSPYEHGSHPLLGYSSLVLDPDRGRILIYLESIDPDLSRAIGINETVERLIVYQTPSGW